MGSKGSTRQVTNSNAYYTPSPQIQGAGTQALQGAQAASQQPFWLPQQPIAGFSPDQLAAFQNVRNMQGMTAPWFGQAGNLAQMSATPLTGEQIQNFYNPMAQNVTNQLQNIFGQQMREATGQARQAAGGVGADRIAVAQANLANQQGLAAGQTYADLYQRALAAAQQNQQMQSNAAYAMGNLGQGAQQSALQATQALGGIGGQQQALAQAYLNAPYQWLGQQFAYPYQANQYLAGVTGALVPAFPSQTTGQSTSTTTPPAPSPISQLAGAGMAGYGAMQGKGGGSTGMSPYMPFGGGSAGAIYRHGGRIKRQLGGQAGSAFPSLSPFTSTGPSPGGGIAPPSAPAMGTNMFGGMPSTDDAARAPSGGVTNPGGMATPQPAPPPQGTGMSGSLTQPLGGQPTEGMQPGIQAGLQQAMQSPQMQLISQIFPWLQQVMQGFGQHQQPHQHLHPGQHGFGRMQNPTFGSGNKGSFGGGFADGGATKAPDIPAMGAGTAGDMDAYFANINKQAQDLSAMSRNAMQPTGSGGWNSPFFGNMFPKATTQGTGSSLLGGLPDKLVGRVQDEAQTQHYPGEGQYIYARGGRTGYAIGGGDDEGIGSDPFGNIDTGVPKTKLTPSSFHGPELPKPPAQSGSSSGSGKGSEIGTVASAAMKFLPMLLAAHGGAVGPFSHMQRFQAGGGDDSMGNIGDFPFTPPDFNPTPPSPEDLRPPVPPPFAGLGEKLGKLQGTQEYKPEGPEPPIPPPLPGLKGPFKGGLTPQEEEQAAASKARWGAQAEATGVPADFPYETAGAAAPEPTKPRPFGGLPALAEVPMNLGQMPGAAPVTPVERRDLPGTMFGMPVAQGAPSQLTADETQRGAGLAGVPTSSLAPNEALNQPSPAGPFAPPTAAAGIAPDEALNVPKPGALPRPRPDIAGAPGQGVSRMPVVPASRQSIAQDVLYYANQHGIPPALAMRLVNQESGFNPRATSSAGAIGVTQLMPGTAKELGVNPYDTTQNIEGGMRYLRKMYDKYGDWKLAAAAYNAGPNTIDGFLAGKRGLPAETRAYVPAVTGGLDLSANAVKPGSGGPETPELGAEGPTGLAPSGISAPQGAPSGLSQYQLPQSQMPFPQSGAQAPGAGAARNPWLMAGLSVMGGTSPYPLVNIGKGVASSLEKQREQAAKEVPVNQAAQRLYLEMQKHVDSMTKLSAAQQLEAMKPFRIGVDPQTGLDIMGVRDLTSNTIRRIDPTTGQIVGPPIGGGAEGPAGADTRDEAVERFKKQDEGTQNQYAAPELAPNLVPQKDETPALLKGPFATGEASAIRQYNQDIAKKVRPALDFQREQITRLKMDYATIMKDEGEGFFTRMAQLPGNPSPEGRVSAMRAANNAAIAARKPPPFDPAKIAAMEEVIKIQNTMGMSFAATISPRDSQQMQMAAIASQPGLTQSPQGFQRLIGLYDGTTSRGEERLRFWNRWQQVNPHRYAGFDDDFETKNPAVKTTIRALVDNSPYPKARERFPDAVKYLREHKDDADYRAKFDKVYGGTSSYFLSGVLDPYAVTRGTP